MNNRKKREDGRRENRPVRCAPHSLLVDYRDRSSEWLTCGGHFVKHRTVMSGQYGTHLPEQLTDTRVSGGQQQKRRENVDDVLEWDDLDVRCCGEVENPVKEDPVHEDRDGQQRERQQEHQSAHAAQFIGEQRRDTRGRCHEERLEERPEARLAPHPIKSVADQEVRSRTVPVAAIGAASHL